MVYCPTPCSCGHHKFDKKKRLLMPAKYTCRNCGDTYTGPPGGGASDNSTDECSQCGRKCGHKSTCRYSHD